MARHLIKDLTVKELRTKYVYMSSWEPYATIIDDLCFHCYGDKLMFFINGSSDFGLGDYCYDTKEEAQQDRDYGKRDL